MGKNVLAYKDTQHKYDFGADEIAFPILLEQDGTEVVAYFVMDAQYPSSEIKSFYADMMGRSKASDLTGERENEAGDDSGAGKFVDNHFRRILGIDGDPSIEEQKAFLDANPRLKSRIFSEGYDRVTLDIEEDAKPAKLRLGGSDNPVVKARRILYDPQTDRVVFSRLDHKYRRETEEDRIKFRRAFKLIERGRYSQVRANFDLLEQLYDSMVESIGNGLYNGEPCQDNTSMAWKPLVPISDKVFVVTRIFSRLSVKNG